MILIFTQFSFSQYQINRGVLNNGADHISGNNLNMTSTLGQHLIGSTENSTHHMHIGFWYTVDWIISDLENPDDLVPIKYELFQNYPNPFNPVTHIRYALPKPDHVKIEVYNLLGQRVVTLVNRRMPPGYHDVTFDALTLPSGFYVYRLQTNGFHDVKKMTVLK